jgi:X-X-X-Leu-X-X-Gly heptad repeat protein
LSYYQRKQRSNKFKRLNNGLSRLNNKFKRLNNGLSRNVNALNISQPTCEKGV